MTMIARKLSKTQAQLVFPLLEALQEAGGEAPASEVYERVADKVGLTEEERQALIPGLAGRYRCFDRDVRWAKQAAQEMGMVETPKRAYWRITDQGRAWADEARPGLVITVYETPFGLAVWADALTAMGRMEDGKFQLILTSPPYALLRPKAYGNVTAEEYIEWLLPFAREWIRLLKPDGSILLNLGHAWTKGAPTVSTYHYRVLLALQDRLGLHLCQEIIWHNPAKLPGPAAWVTVQRLRLKDDYEHLFWLAKSPWPKAHPEALNVPYSDSMRRVLQAGGMKHQVRPSGHVISGGFDRDNGGAICGTVWSIANTSSNDPYLRGCREVGEKPHDARMPLELARKGIQLTTDVGDWVLDPFGGSMTTGQAAEELQRRWVGIDLLLHHIAGSVFRFQEVAVYNWASLTA